MRKLLFVVLGLMFWLATQWLALAMAGGGHGWLDPIWLSPFLIVLYPIAFIRAFCATGPSRVDRDLLVISVVLDLLLLGRMFISMDLLLEVSRADYYLLVVVLWIALWVGWQVPSVATWIRSRGTSIEAEGS